MLAGTGSYRSVAKLQVGGITDTHRLNGHVSDARGGWLATKITFGLLHFLYALTIGYFTICSDSIDIAVQAIYIADVLTVAPSP